MADFRVGPSQQRGAKFCRVRTAHQPLTQHPQTLSHIPLKSKPFGAHLAMSTNSSIEWTETTWNPVTGCTKISHGCKFCYAERMSVRLRAMGVDKYRDGFSITVHESALENPLKWRKPRLVFVNSMSDLFHKSVPTAFIESVFETMNQASQHTFQVLTKRPSRVDQGSG